MKINLHAYTTMSLRHPSNILGQKLHAVCRQMAVEYCVHETDAIAYLIYTRPGNTVLQEYLSTKYDLVVSEWAWLDVNTENKILAHGLDFQETPELTKFLLTEID